MEKYTGLEIAVIGMAGKFPEADNIQQFWENLKNGKDCISHFTEEEVAEEGEQESLLKNSSYVKANAYLKNKKNFDSGFFGYTPHEAELMDPQVRLYHECCWEALEDSGCNMQDRNLKVGVFSAGYPNIPWILHTTQNSREAGFVDDFTAAHLRDATFLSSRIAYKLNLKGPAVFIQTACSSSLVAIHEGCNSLLLGECNMVLAGGVNVKHYSKKGYVYQEGMIHSKDGKCRPFDAESSGTVSGEGVGVVVLKRLKDAIRDKDNIQAIIKGTAINNDGSNKVGYTAPSVQGQAEVIKRAHAMAKVNVNSISYIETHGTATELGDPIEVEALNTAFGKDSKNKCAIGSVKSNIGHLDSAAGVAGFIKTVLALKKRELPPSLHYTKENPVINFSNSPFNVNNTLKQWGTTSDTLRAGVSSFGIGGTNAHLILQEAPKRTSSESNRNYQLMTLSGKTIAGFHGNIAKFKKFLNEHRQLNLADAAYTLQTGRGRFKYRKTIICNTIDNTLEELEKISSLEPVLSGNQEELQHVVFMFPGQGTQYVNMCKALYTTESVFREEIDKCLEYAKAYTTTDLRSVLFGDTITASNEINETENAQPLLFIVEYALANLLLRWGITPDYMIGHSIGEYVAACLSDVFELEDAIRLVIKRGSLMSKALKGTMLTIKASRGLVVSFLETYNSIDLAIVNSEDAIVVSGTSEDIDNFKSFLDNKEISSKKLHTSHAFHSRMMDSVLKDFDKELKKVNIKSPKIPFISNVSGVFVDPQEIKTSSYWTEQLRNTVNFKQGIDTLLIHGDACFIEVGPGRTLSNYVNENKNKTSNHHAVNIVRHVKQNLDDQKYLLGKLGELWEKGIEIKWEKFYDKEERYKVSLPTYAFEKKEYTTNFNLDKLLNKQLAPDTSAIVKNETELINVHNWQRSILPNDAIELGNGKLSFLIFTGTEKFSDVLNEKLRVKHQNIVLVKEGKEFKKINDKLFELNISVLDQLDQLWVELGKIKFKADEIIYGLPLSTEYTLPDYKVIDKALIINYLGISYITKTIVNYQNNEDVRITVLCNHLAKVVADDNVDPLKAIILSPVKIIPSEINTLRCKVIDIPYPFISENEQVDYAEMVLNEMFFETNDAFVAYRYKERWFKGVETFSENEKTASNVSLVAGGTYLIVGGTGGIGLSIVSQMSSEVQGVFILVHRNDFPKKETWSEWLEAHDDRDDISKKILQIQEIENLGSIVKLNQLDVADQPKVKVFSEELLNDQKQINGLVWAAGEVDYGGIIINRSKEDFLKYSRSKIHGIVLFEKYIKFDNLDFLALFSSIGNVIYQVKFGQVAYNAGNEFLESYADYAKKQWGIHAFTINWCDWYDVGLTFNAVRRQDDIEDIVEINSRIDHAISPKKGVELFFRCLKNKQSVFTMFPGQLEETISSQRLLLHGFKNSSVNGAKEISGSILNEIDDLETILKGIYSTFFGKEIGAGDDFFEAGGDSLKAMSLSARINQRIGSNLAINDIYECPTIKEVLDKVSIMSSENKVVTIPNTPSKEFYATSSEQKRMFLLQVLDVNSTLYNEIEVLWVIGEINKKKVEEAFKQIIQRHESLRTSFTLVGDELKQEVSENYDFYIESLEYRKDQLDKTVKSFIRPFDLADKNTPLLRVGIVEKSPTEHLLIMDSHHIVMDGVSRFILREEFNTLYNDGVLSPLKIQYKDYAEWQNSEEQKARIAEDKSFWLNEFSGELQPLELPTDFVRPLTTHNEGDFIRFEIGEEETKKLKKIATKGGTTVYTVLVAVLNVLLSKLTNQEDVIIATPVAGRQHADLENLIGMFVNTVCIRSYPEGEKPFGEFLSEVKDKTLECFKNQSYPFEELVRELKIVRDNSRNPLFDVMFVYQNYEEAKNKTEGLIFKPEQFNHTSSRFDMTLLAVDDADQLFLRLVFSTELFKKDTIKRFAAYFKNIVSAIIDTPRISLSDIDIIPKEEKEALLVDFNDFDIDFPKDKVSIQLFEECTFKLPEAIALIDGDKSINYRELNNWANVIAQEIDKKIKGNGNDKIGLLFNSSIEMIASILGILKTGNTYVPISPNTLQERNKYILSDCDAKLVLIQESLKTNENVASLVDDEKTIWISNKIRSSSNIKFESKKVTSEDIMYVIYTSGTTGIPKGVEVKYSGITNMLYAFKKKFEMGKSVKSTHLANITFDASVFELWPSLAFGGCLHIVSPEMRLDPELLKKWLVEEKIEILFLPTVLAEHLLKEEEYLQDSSLKVINVAGDRLNYLPAKKLPYKIYNLYGPTEDSIWTTSSELNYERIKEYYSIGKPIANKKVLILDAYNKIQPIGVPGEICITGAGLTKGYINNEKLTNEKFIKNPFNLNELMYRTGDKGCWHSDGEIKFLGRIDHQVKIRGFRIELGEIETHLSKYPQIKDSAVTAKGGEGDKYLVAYYVNEGTINIKELKSYLLEKLPDYMIPSYFVKIDKLPITANGKLNRKALPLPTGFEYNDVVAPETESERIVKEVWEVVLGTSNIGVTDNFFLVGGDSIKSIQISSRLRSLGYEISVKDILTSLDIRILATKLKKIKRLSDQSSVTGEAKLSPIQRWFFDNNLVDKNHFNQSVLLNFEGGISKEMVTVIFKKITEHHDVLRTVYRKKENDIIASYLDIDETSFSLKVCDFENSESPEDDLLLESEKIQSRINITTGPLMKLGLFHMNKGSRLLIVIHHLVIDGVSWRILFEDIETLYQQIKSEKVLQLPLKTDAFKIWTNKLHDYAESSRMKLAQGFWNNELKEKVSSMKRDFPEGENKHKNKVIEKFELDREITSKLLLDVHNAFGTQINDILLAAFLWAYSEFYNVDNVFVDLESHGRENLGLDENIGRTLGWFTSFYPVLLKSSKVDVNHLNELIKNIKEKLRKIPNNGIDYLINKKFIKNDEVQKLREGQISFNYLGQFNSEIENCSFQIGEEAIGNEVSLENQRDYDWDVGGIITNDKLTMSLSYSCKQYHQDTIHGIMSSFKKNLIQLIEYSSNCQKKEFSPSDFSYKDLSFSQLEILSKEYDIQNICSLSPMQEGMLFHYLMNPESESYLGQMIFEVDGALDIDAIQKSINELINRHEVLRTAFVYEGVERPVQIVLNQRAIKIDFRNLQKEIPKEDIEKEIERYKLSEQKNSFDLSQDFLLRMSILQTSDNKYTFLWSYHHIIMDGWCTAIILSEFREIYSKIKNNLKIKLPQVNSYHTYIEWLEEKDKQKSDKYWKNYLGGYNNQVSMPKIEGVAINKEGFDLAREKIIIGKEETKLLQELTIEYGVTMSTIIQCAWGMLLAKYNNVDEVVFGIVVSGRPSEVDGIENMIGLFINTIPVRIKYDVSGGISEILRSIQENSLENDQHQYYPLSEIQSNSSLGRDLFNHIVVVENYPILEDTKADVQSNNFLVKNAEMFEQSNYDLSLVVVPNENIEIKIEYNANVYEKIIVKNILRHLNHIILQVLLPTEIA